MTLLVQWIAVTFGLLLTMYGSIDCTKHELSKDSPGVCNKITSYMQSYQETYVDSRQTFVNKPCGIFNMRTCASSRPAYRLGHRSTYKTSYRTSYLCCEGWTSMRNRCEPTCDPQCFVDESCVGPNKCEVSSQSDLHFKPQKVVTRLKRQAEGGGSGGTSHLSAIGENIDCFKDDHNYIPKFVSPGNTEINVTWVDIPTVGEGTLEECNATSNQMFPIGITLVQCTIKGRFGPEGNVDKKSCIFVVDVKRGKCLPDTSSDAFSWPETLAGAVANSTQGCPIDTEGGSRNLALATRQCMFKEQSEGIWAPVENTTKTDCGQQKQLIIDDLKQISLDENSVREVADILVNITATSDGNIDIVDISEVISNIADVQSSSPEVTDAVIEIVNNILDADVPQDGYAATASSMILKAIDEQIARTLEENGRFKSVRPNIAVEGVTINESSIGVGFAIQQMDSGISNADITNDLNTNSGNHDSSSFIQLPKNALENTNGTQVSFIGYNDDKLFQSNITTQNITIMTPIISAVVLGKKVTNLEEQVVVKFIPSSKNMGISMNTSRCVYWDFELRDGIGEWVDKGCVLVAADSEGITCHCNHLTNFAVLVDFTGQSEPGTLTFALDIISKIGCAFSIGALCLTLIIFILSSQLRISLQRKILIQFCISMLCLYLAFLIGIDSETDAACTAAAFLLHYFVLSTVFWMGVEARHMYITLVSESDRVGRKFMMKAGVFAWGVPLIPVGVVLGLKWDDYRANGYCFIAPDYGLYFGLLLPVGLVILHNFVTFIFVTKQLLSTKSYTMRDDLEGGNDTSDVKEIAQRMLNAFSVSMILGITWIFGFLAVDEVRFAFQLIFCICNSFQGVMIFILFCLAQKDVRKLLGQKCCSGSSSQSRPTKKQKQPVNHAGKQRKGAPVTSMSDSTRVSGESYSDDGETMVTKLDNDTMTMDTM